MPMHKIEVDDVIYRYLKSKAEPFVDTPNTVLHRELFGNNSSLSVGHVQDIPQLPVSTPAALQHIIEVVHLVKAGDYDRSEATKIVARRHGVARETIQDKYTRQLGLTASDFDVLLAESNESKLIERLNRRFPGHKILIEQLRENYENKMGTPVIVTGHTICKSSMSYKEALIAACRWLNMDPSNITEEEDQLISILDRLTDWEGEEAREAKAVLEARVRMFEAGRKPRL